MTELLYEVALAKIATKQKRNTHKDNVLLLLWRWRNKKVPLTKLVYDLRCHRFWEYIRLLRKIGFNIETVFDWYKQGKRCYSYILHYNG